MQECAHCCLLTQYYERDNQNGTLGHVRQMIWKEFRKKEGETKRNQETEGKTGTNSEQQEKTRRNNT